MNVKKAFCILVFISLVFSALAFVSADDGRSYSITDAIVNLTVEDSGLLHVDERYDYSFQGTYNGVYRDIPLKSQESIENIKVSAIGAYPTYTASDENGQKHLKIYLYGDADHTKKIRDCDVSVFISYDMKNTVTLFNDVAGLQFQLWGKEWDVGVGSIHASVKLPGDKNNTFFINPEEYTKSSNLNGDEITVESNPIRKGEIYELLVLMPLDDFKDASNARHVNENGKDKIIKNLNDSLAGRSFWNTVYLMLGSLALIIPVAAILIYIKYGREPKVDYEGIYERDLPSDDSPELINALIDNKENIGQPNMKGFEASILNMIDRKILKVSTGEDADTHTKDLFISFDRTRFDELSESEKIVFNALENFAHDNTLNLSKLNNQLSFEANAKWFLEQYSSWQESIESVAKTKRKEYFDDTGDTIVSVLAIASFFIGGASAVLGFTSSLSGGFIALCGGIFLIIFSVALFMLPEDIFGRWTKEGRIFYLKWSNLKKFLKDNSLIKEHPPESIVIWKKYLIYGAALGVADNVYRAMKLQVPNIHEYDDSIFIYHSFGGYYLMHDAFKTGESAANPSSDTGSFGGFGGGSGGGGGGAF